MELSYATRFGKGDGWKRNEGREGGRGKREEGRGKREEGRGAHTTALLARCFRGIAAQRDGPPEKLAKPADPAEPGAWRVQGIEDR
jgi:hypothetical protein